MRHFLITASDDICRDGQYVNFEALSLQGKTEIDKSSGDGEWYYFEGEFVLDACVLAENKEEALQIISRDYHIPVDYLRAYELA